MSLEDNITEVKKRKFKKMKNNSYRKDEGNQATYYVLYHIIKDTKVGWKVGYVVCEKRVNKDTGEEFYCKYKQSTKHQPGIEDDHRTYEGSFFVPEEDYKSLEEGCRKIPVLPNADLKYVYLWDEELDHNFYMPMGLFESLMKKLKD